MASKLIIHIGTHKTGTTALQSFLDINSLRLKEHRIIYPENGRFLNRNYAQAHRYVSDYFRDKKISDGEFNLDKLKEKSKKYNIVLSSEGFYFASNESTVAKISDALGSQSEVICYFRDPSEHIVSLYNEYLKGGLSSSLSSFIENERSKLLENNIFSYYSYEKNTKFWSDNFSKVTVKKYKKTSNALELASNFFDDIGMEINLTDCEIGDMKNKSVSNLQNAVMHKLNQIFYSNSIEKHTWSRLKKITLTKNKTIDELFSPFVEVIESDFTLFANSFNTNNSNLIKSIHLPLSKRIQTDYFLNISDALALKKFELLANLK